MQDICLLQRGRALTDIILILPQDHSVRVPSNFKISIYSQHIKYCLALHKMKFQHLCNVSLFPNILNSTIKTYSGLSAGKQT